MRLSIEQYLNLLCIDSCYWKLLRKYCQTVTHALFYCSTVYTVILSTLLLLYHWYCCCHCIIPVIEITWILIDLNYNVIEQHTTELGKFREEIAYVFWVDLGYRLRSRDTVPLLGSGGWLTSRIVHIVGPRGYTLHYFVFWW